MNSPFFSVIIPVYNSEKYISDAVNSILSQTFGDFELILVDDCSSDSSLSLCKAFSEADSRVKAISLTDNGGASRARTAGLNEAKGRYLYFMDADDTLEPFVFNEVRKETEKCSPDIVMFGARELFIGKGGELYKSVELIYPEKHLLDSESVRREIIEIEKTTLFGYLWNKFYSAEAVRRSNAVFENLKLNEDFKYNIDLADSIESMSCLGFIGYNYFKRDEQSLTSSSVFVEDYFDLQLMRITSLYNSYKRWKLYSDSVRAALGGIYIRSVFSALQRNCDGRSGFTAGERKKWLRAVYSDALFNELVPFAEPESGLVKIMQRLLAKKSVFGALLAGRFIYTVKTKTPSLFTHLSHNN